MREAGLNVDAQSMDWGAVVSRRAKKEPPAQGGWNIFVTTSGGVGSANPVLHTWIGAACDKGLFGWPCDQEIEKLVEFIAKQGKPSYEPEIHQRLQSTPSSMGSMSLDPESEVSDADEDLIQKCIEVIRSDKKASVSLLQRRLKLGYGRASRLMDELEDRGIVGPSKGAEPRDILLDLDGQGYDGGGQSMV